MIQNKRAEVSDVDVLFLRVDVTYREVTYSPCLVAAVITPGWSLRGLARPSDP